VFASSLGDKAGEVTVSPDPIGPWTPPWRARPPPPAGCRLPPAAEDLDRELLAALALATATTHREAALTQRGFPQVQLVLLEERRVLEAKEVRQRSPSPAVDPGQSPGAQNPTEGPYSPRPTSIPVRPTCIMALLATAARPGRSAAPGASNASVITALLWSNRMDGATKEYPCRKGDKGLMRGGTGVQVIGRPGQDGRGKAATKGHGGCSRCIRVHTCVDTFHSTLFYNHTKYVCPLLVCDPTFLITVISPPKVPGTEQWPGKCSPTGASCTWTGLLPVSFTDRSPMPMSEPGTHF
jgi:hypothetical protein